MEYIVYSPQKNFTITAENHNEAVHTAADNLLLGSEFIVNGFHYHKYEEASTGIVKIVQK